MTTDKKESDLPGGGSSCGKEIAWPGRLVSMLLGTPAGPGGPVPRGLRYRACSKCANSIGIVNVVVNTFLMIIKGYLGVIGQSTALVADAIHSGADVVSAVMLFFGLKVAKRASNQEYPYGYGKVEFLVALVIYSSLIAAGVVIFMDAITCIVHKKVVTPSMVTIFGAGLSVVVNEMMFRQSICAGSQLNSPSMIANAWEKRSDALSSIAVLFGIIGAKLGYHFLDPLAAVIVAIYIVKFSIEQILEAFKGLVDTALKPDIVRGIRESAEGVEGVLGIEAVRSREIGQKVWIDLEVIVDGGACVGAVDEIRRNIRTAVSNVINREADIAVYLRPASS